MKDLSHERPLRFEAAPFYPHMMACSPHPSLEFAIYNDGQPTLMATCEAEVSEILHGIQDDALDEQFPPDAQDAAELEDVDAFNEMQALLALMEERDQTARKGFCHIQRRWEVRRSQGLAMGRKPKPAHMTMESKAMPHASRSHVTTRAIVSHAHHSKAGPDKVMRDPVVMHQMGRNKMMNQHAPRQIPIQQPRKQN